MTIPIFKSTYSIGKSILTMDDPNCVTEGGADSIIAIAKENSLQRIALVEDTMIGFLDSHQKCKTHGIKLHFGLRLSCCNNVADEDKKASEHKIVIFAKNDEAVKRLTRIFSIANQKHQGFVDNTVLVENWSKDLLLCIPFYDSFIYNNNFRGKQCLPSFKFTQAIYFIESNGLPFDAILETKVRKWADTSGERVQQVQSIYYKLRSDFEAWQTYKCICNRTFGKEQSLSSPNLEHCGSDSFCWEAFVS